jgi:hypothetical protein
MSSVHCLLSVAGDRVVVIGKHERRLPGRRFSFQPARSFSNGRLGTINRRPIRMVGSVPAFAAAYAEHFERPRISQPASSTVKVERPSQRESRMLALLVPPADGPLLKSVFLFTDLSILSSTFLS